MKTTIKSLAVLISVAGVSACSSSSTLFPSSDGKMSTEAKNRTFINTKIKSFRTELDALKELVKERKEALTEMRNDTNKYVSAYRKTVMGINSKLQMGSTPGNPDLMDQWTQARTKLEKVNNIAFDIKRLAADIESDVSMTEYMYATIGAAYKISGASEAEHTQLKALQDEVNQLSAKIGLFVKNVNKESDKQVAYVEKEKHTLNDVALDIKKGRSYGGNNTGGFYSNGASEDLFGDMGSATSFESFEDEDMTSSFAPAPTRAAAPRRGGRKSFRRSSSRSLISVKFTKGVNYEEPLYQALSRALERDPSATFEVVSVASTTKVARSNTRKVVKTLTKMGMPSSRINLKTEVRSVPVGSVEIFAN